MEFFTAGTTSKKSFVVVFLVCCREILWPLGERWMKGGRGAWLMADEVLPSPTSPPSLGVEGGPYQHRFTAKGNWNVGGSKTSFKRKLCCRVEVFTGVSTSTHVVPMR